MCNFPGFPGTPSKCLAIPGSVATLNILTDFLIGRNMLALWTTLEILAKLILATNHAGTSRCGGGGGRGGRRGEGVVIVVERILCHYSTLRVLVNCLCARGMLPMLDWVKQKHTTKRLSFFEHVSFEHNAVKVHSLLVILVRKCNNNHLQITN